MPQRGRTSAKLAKDSSFGDKILEEGIIARQDAERLARFLRREKTYPELAQELEIAAERDIHVMYRANRELNGTLKEGQRWQKYPRDPVLYPNTLPKAVFEDEDFDPMCVYCRVRYGL